MKSVEVLKSDNYAGEVIEKLTKLLKERDTSRPFHMFLSGGSTPKVVYAGLAEQSLDWNGIHLWWGDERFVPADHADSNFRMVKEQLLDRVEIPNHQIHPWPILSTPELSASTYDQEFRTYFERHGHTLDLQLLGMGDDGHTASLFPETPALENTEDTCVENTVPCQDCVRLTLTYQALALSERIVFLVKGDGKAEALHGVIDDHKHPAAKVENKGSIEFWLDKGAAKKLKPLKK